jgi:hypothetical protein
VSDDEPGSTRKPGRTLSIIGIVLDVIALAFLPVVAGVAGAILGFLAYRRGDKPLGLYVGIGGIVATVVGFLLGGFAATSTR